MIWLRFALKIACELAVSRKSLTSSHRSSGYDPKQNLYRTIYAILRLFQINKANRTIDIQGTFVPNKTLGYRYTDAVIIPVTPLLPYTYYVLKMRQGFPTFAQNFTIDDSISLWSDPAIIQFRTTSTSK